MIRLAVGLIALLACGPTAAEDLTAALSTDRIAVTSTFTGAKLTVFGSVERDSAAVGRAGGYDIAVVVRGPPETVTTRRKERVLGLWINRGAERHIGVPSYYAALSNRPIEDIAALKTRQSLQIGFDSLVLPVASETLSDSLKDYESFAAAFLRLKQGQSLYQQTPDAVTFLSPSLFRATIPAPAHAPIGDYQVSITLFADGTPLKTQTMAFSIEKEGFEYAVVALASERPLLYAFITLTFAFGVGWLSNVLFRRD